MSPAMTRAARRVIAMSCSKRRQERTRASACSLHDGVGKESFAGAGVDEDAKTAPEQNPRYSGITFGGPALGAPACAGIDEGRGRAFVFIHEAVGPGFRCRVDGKRRLDIGEFVTGDGFSEFQVLLDHVLSGSGYPLVEKPTGDALAWLGLADESAATGHAPEDRRSDSTLEVEHRVVLSRAEGFAQGSDLAAGLRCEKIATPILGRR